MYSAWPTVEKIGEFRQLDHAALQRTAATFSSTAVTNYEVPLLFGDFVVGCTAFGASLLFFPQPDEWEIATRLDYYRIGYSVTGKKMAFEVGIELMGYSAGAVKRFETPVDLSYLTSFQQDILLACRRIPFGEVVTNAELAEMAGYPRKGGRAAMVLKNNPLPILIPCHRVLPANRTLGNYCGPLEWKQLLLAHEGVEMSLVSA